MLSTFLVKVHSCDRMKASKNRDIEEIKDEQTLDVNDLTLKLQTKILIFDAVD